MPFFSVIIPLYNKEKYIGDTLNSALKQTFEDFEIIIVDDGSTDKSYQIVSKFKDPRIIKIQQKNKGVSEARNTAIACAKSKYIALLDADDIWNSNHLEEHYKSIKKFPQAALYSNSYFVKLTETKLIKATYNVDIKNTTKIHIVEDYFTACSIYQIAWTSAIVINKKDFYDVGGYNPKIKSGEDIDLLIRFGINKSIVFNSKHTCYYDKTVKNSLSKINDLESKFKLFTSYKNHESTNKYLKQYLNLYRYSLAIQCILSKNKDTFQKLLPEIDMTLLNYKQKILLRMPHKLLAFLKKTHLFLINRGIYISSFK